MEKKKVVKILLCVFVAIIIGASSVTAIYINNTLNRINYDNESTGVATEDNSDEQTTKALENLDINDYELQTDSPTKPEETTSSIAEIKKAADEAIKKNLANNGDVWHSNDVFNLLIIGYDAGDDEAVMFDGMKYPRADCIIVASINKKTEQISLVSLSRATYVGIPGHGNQRINAAYSYGGPKMLIQVIETNYKIKIDNYVACDFGGFEDIVNAMDGISIKMSTTEASFAFNKETPAGTYKMNGSEALRYVRLRKTDSDRVRTGRQRKMLTAMFNKAKSMSISEDVTMLNVILPYITTNMSKAQIVSKISEMPSYKRYKIAEDIIPHKAVKLSNRNGKEVLIIDWNYNVSHLHESLYNGTQVEKIPAIS